MAGSSPCGKAFRQSTIALTFFYYDQRIRKEGYDIERMMDAAGMSRIAILAVANDGQTAQVIAEEEAHK